MKRLPFAIIGLVLVAGAAWWVQNAQSPSEPTSTIEINQEQTNETAAASAPTGQTETSQEIEEDVETKVVGAASGLVLPGVPGGTLALTAIGGPDTFNPLRANSLASTSALSLLGAGLVEFNPVSKEIEPALAARWEWSDDHTQIVFHLRRGVRFSDGQPFNAEDVLFTFNDLIYNPDVETDYRSVFQVSGQPLTVEALDAHVVRFTLAAPFQPVLKAFTVPILPKHLLADQVSKLNLGIQGTIPRLRIVMDEYRKALEFASVDDVEAMDWAVNDLESTVQDQSVERAQAALDEFRARHAALRQVEDPAFALDDALGHLDRRITDLQNDLDAQNWAGAPVGTFNNAWSVDTPPDRIAGLGPFRLKNYTVGEQLVLERNPHYWKRDEQDTPLPYLDAISFRFVDTLDQAKSAFVSAQSDALLVRPEDWDDLIQGVQFEPDCDEKTNQLVCIHPTQHYTLLRGGPIYDTVFVTFNQDAADPVLRAVFRAKAFRQAIAHAIDKNTLVEDVYNGLGAAQWGPVNPSSPAFDGAATVTYPFDLGQAAKLLDDIGLVDVDGDGVRNISNAFLQAAGVESTSLPESQRNENFRELTFTFKTFTGSGVIEASSQMILDAWTPLGLDVTFQFVEFNNLLNDLFSGQFDAALMGFAVGLDPLESANTWRSDGALHFWHPSAFDQPFEWEARIDEIFLELTTAFDPERRQALLSEFQRILSENVPLIFTVNNRFLYAYRSDLRNTDAFQPLLGGFPTVLAFAETLWREREP